MKKESDIFPREIFKSDIVFHRKICFGHKILKYLSTFQIHWKIEHKQLKSNKIKQDMCKSDSIFPNLESSTIFD